MLSKTIFFPRNGVSSDRGSVKIVDHYTTNPDNDEIYFIVLINGNYFNSSLKLNRTNKYDIKNSWFIGSHSYGCKF